MENRILPQVNILHVGEAQTPVLFIDHAFPDPEYLLQEALNATFSPQGQYFPGVRALAPEVYRNWLVKIFARDYLQLFQQNGKKIGLDLCHYSVVTTPPSQLMPLQRIPHIDSSNAYTYAMVHYLFLEPHGGTAFYRHRSTGYERVDQLGIDSFNQIRIKELENLTGEPDYIEGDTKEYLKIGEVEGGFNRLVIYPQNLLHCSVIHKPFEIPKTMRQARLSINSFVRVEVE